jgi:hypothetical protein
VEQQKTSARGEYFAFETRTSLRTFDTETGVAEAGLALDGLAQNVRRLETATRGDGVKSEP